MYTPGNAGKTNFDYKYLIINQYIPKSNIFRFCINQIWGKVKTCKIGQSAAKFRKSWATSIKLPVFPRVNYM